MWKVSDPKWCSSYIDCTHFHPTESSLLCREDRGAVSSWSASSWRPLVLEVEIGSRNPPRPVYCSYHILKVNICQLFWHSPGWDGFDIQYTWIWLFNRHIWNLSFELHTLCLQNIDPASCMILQSTHSLPLKLPAMLCQHSGCLLIVSQSSSSAQQHQTKLLHVVYNCPFQ